MYKDLEQYTRIQKYIYEKKTLQDGDKFSNDFRTNRIGQHMQKMWIGKLHVFINILKGEMKIIRVRPLSKQIFSLYTKINPGLYNNKTMPSTSILC